MGYLVLIGTKKGLFTATSDDRRDWALKGPHALDTDGFTAVAEIYAAACDPHTGQILVGAESPHFGPSIWRSDDLAATWHEPQTAPLAFPQDLPYRPLDFSEAPGTDQPDSEHKNTVKRIWQIAFAPADGLVWAGVEPTSLWHSDDGGRTFTFNRALWEHPDHETWGPGGGGAAVHTIVPDPHDPQAVTIAMSAGGIYQTRDGGRSWTGVTKGITVDYGPDPEPASGQCIHKVARDAEGAFFVQSHGPAYHSSDPTQGWNDISASLPSNFGFHITAHPTRPGTALAYPVSDSMDRFPPDHRISAWRTDDAGATWRQWGSGLPTEDYFGIVLRDAACHDHDTDPAWYFGTRCGDVWTAPDSTGQWRQVAAHLPDVLCVRAMNTTATTTA